VKEYSRSSADQEEPLPHDLRPLPTLEKTMKYLMGFVVDSLDAYPDDTPLGEWYNFLWDRTRAVRKVSRSHSIRRWNCTYLKLAFSYQLAIFWWYLFHD
jgi:hypothetical protein